MLEDVVSYADRILGLAIEFHDTGPLRPVFERTMEVVRRRFEIVHVHANNFTPPYRDGFPEALEITVARKDLVRGTRRRKISLSRIWTGPTIPVVRITGSRLRDEPSDASDRNSSRKRYVRTLFPGTVAVSAPTSTCSPRRWCAPAARSGSKGVGTAGRGAVLHSLLMTAGVVMAQRWATLTGRPQFDVNFFIESVFPEYLPTGRVNCLFVHPEWFRDENLAHLPRLDFVLCKTPSGVDAFRGLPVVLPGHRLHEPGQADSGVRAARAPSLPAPVGSECGQGIGGRRRGVVAPSRVAGT